MKNENWKIEISSNNCPYKTKLWNEERNATITYCIENYPNEMGKECKAKDCPLKLIRIARDLN